MKVSLLLLHSRAGGHGTCFNVMLPPMLPSLLHYFIPFLVLISLSSSYRFYFLSFSWSFPFLGLTSSVPAFPGSSHHFWLPSLNSLSPSHLQGKSSGLFSACPVWASCYSAGRKPPLEALQIRDIGGVAEMQGVVLIGSVCLSLLSCWQDSDGVEWEILRKGLLYCPRVDRKCNPSCPSKTGQALRDGI